MHVLLAAVVDLDLLLARLALDHQPIGPRLHDQWFDDVKILAEDHDARLAGLSDVDHRPVGVDHVQDELALHVVSAEIGIAAFDHGLVGGQPHVDVLVVEEIAQSGVDLRIDRHPGEQLDRLLARVVGAALGHLDQVRDDQPVVQLGAGAEGSEPGKFVGGVVEIADDRQRAVAQSLPAERRGGGGGGVREQRAANGHRDRFRVHLPDRDVLNEGDELIGAVAVGGGNRDAR